MVNVQIIYLPLPQQLSLSPYLKAFPNIATVLRGEIHRGVGAHCTQGESPRALPPALITFSGSFLKGRKGAAVYH